MGSRPSATTRDGSAASVKTSSRAQPSARRAAIAAGKFAEEIVRCGAQRKGDPIMIRSTKASRRDDRRVLSRLRVPREGRHITPATPPRSPTGRGGPGHVGERRRCHEETSVHAGPQTKLQLSHARRQHLTTPAQPQGKKGGLDVKVWTSSRSTRRSRRRPRLADDSASTKPRSRERRASARSTGRHVGHALALSALTDCVDAAAAWRRGALCGW